MIVNDDLDRAYNLLEKIALGEENVTADALPPFDDEFEEQPQQQIQIPVSQS